MTEHVIRSAYSPRLRVALDFEGTVSMARQAHKDECDINFIVGRYLAGGLLPQARGAFFGDVSEVPPDFREALEVVERSRDAFAELPSKVRARFGNDPAEVLDFLRDPANREEAIELGLIEKPPASEPVVTASVEGGAQGSEATA